MITILCPEWNVHCMNPCDLCEVGGADSCNPRGVTAVGSQAGFNLQPPASVEPQSERISGWEADVSPGLQRHRSPHSIVRTRGKSDHVRVFTSLSDGKSRASSRLLKAVVDNWAGSIIFSTVDPCKKLKKTQSGQKPPKKVATHVAFQALESSRCNRASQVPPLPTPPRLLLLIRSEKRCVCFPVSTRTSKHVTASTQQEVATLPSSSDRIQLKNEPTRLISHAEHRLKCCSTKQEFIKTENSIGSLLCASNLRVFFFFFQHERSWLVSE